MEKRSRLSQPERWLVDLFGGGESSAGTIVNEDTALQVGAVFACVSRLSETVGSLPIILYKREGDGKSRAAEKNLYRVLHDLPNPEMTAMTFKETMMTHCLLYGRSFAEIVRDNRGQIIELWPIMPYRVRIDTTKGRTEYVITLHDNKEKRLSRDQMFYMPWLTNNGVEAYRPIQLAREIIGLAMATEQFSAKYFKNGTNTGGVVEHPGKLSDPAFTRLQKSMQEKYEGLGNAHRMLLLEEGMKFQKIIIPPNDSQMLESRKHQVEEVARFYNVPPHIIQDLSRATFSNIEEQGTYYAVHTIRPWAVRWEQAIYRCLLTEAEKKIYFAELLFDALMRGNIQSRYQAYSVARQWGFMSVNEIRQKENMNPIGEQGDVYLQPMNMIDAENAEELEELNTKPEEEKSFVKDLETRKAEASNRFAVTQSYKSVFEDAAARVVRREKEKVLAEAKKHLTTRDRFNFYDWLDRFYEQEFPDYFKRQMKAPIKSLAVAIKELAEKEVDAENIDINEIIEEYLDAFTVRYSNSSRGQLKRLVEDAYSEAENELEAVEARVGEWEEKRADKVAMNETVQLGGFVAKTVFAAAGITLLRWVNTGSKTCEFCSQLDGKVMGIDKPFLDKDQEIVSKDGFMSVRGPRTQPPLHQFCQCTLIAERQ